jgi:hypothetical protein
MSLFNRPAEPNKPALVWWIVYAGLSVTMVEAVTYKEAKKAALAHFGFEHKPYLARDWKIRVACDEEKKRYAALADAYRRSQKTASTAKRTTKTAKERLFP